jgi:hypothetical protein
MLFENDDRFGISVVSYPRRLLFCITPRETVIRVMSNVWLTATPQFADAGVISLLFIITYMVPSQY